jgi:Kef-type K+ transport system membrane component KefB
LSRNLDKEKRLMDVEFGHGGELFFLILFVVAGANLHLDELSSAGLIAVAFVLARLLAKSVAVYGPLRRLGLDSMQAGMVGLTLVPMAGLAIGLTQVTYTMYPDFGRELSAIVLASVALLETIGPIMTKYALIRAGEVAPDKRIEH